MSGERNFVRTPEWHEKLNRILDMQQERTSCIKDQIASVEGAEAGTDIGAAVSEAWCSYVELRQLMLHLKEMLLPLRMETHGTPGVDGYNPELTINQALECEEE